MIRLIASSWNRPLGNTFEKYVQGDNLDNLTQEEKERLIRIGAAEEVSKTIVDEIIEDAPIQEKEEAEEDVEVEETPKVSLPAKAAPMKDWIAVAKKLGITHSGLKKAELIGVIQAAVNN